jgi:uncharacterized membrane protein YqjE
MSELGEQGLRPAVARFAAGAIGLLRARAELASVELSEASEHVQRRLLFAFGGAMLVLFGVLGLGALIVVLFWETHRLAAILVVSLALLGVGAALLLKAKSMGRELGTPFAATLAELEKDRAWLLSRRPEA